LNLNVLYRVIVIKIEVWPGGNMAKSHEIARGEIENCGDPDGVIDGVAIYKANWTENGRTVTRIVDNHHKNDSILELVKKSIP
jgi:hypothetical protein